MITHQIAEMPIDSYLIFDNVTVVRTANTHYMVLRDGAVNHVVCGHHSVGYAIALTVEAVTGIPQMRPCSKCGQPTDNRSHCPACHSDGVQASKRRKREREAA